MGQFRISRRAALALLGTCFGSTLSALHASEPLTGLKWQTDYAHAQRLRATSNRPLLVFVTTDGCPFCHKMLKTTYADTSVASDVTETFVPTLVNGAQQSKIVQQFGIRIYPTTFVVGPDNRVIDKIEGFMPPDKFRQRLAAASRRMAMQTTVGTKR